MHIKQNIGNKALWERDKTLFLTSKMAPIGCYGKVFQWVESFDKSGCVVCFNTSELEEEVLKALLVCKVPTVLVVTKSFHDNYNVQIEQALNEKRLLILVLQREESDKGLTARLRNQWAIGQVQHVVCGYINTNGTIFGLLAGLDNVTHIVDKPDLMAAEPEPKPHRWTVAEDKRLLRMFYEDMGIHAIHRAINRPYSTIYNRIKALSMNDEVLKGRQFEDYVVDFFALPHNKTLTLKEWRGDKTLPGVYPESNSDPDLVFEYDGHVFAIECKWRSHVPKDIEKELLSADRRTLFEQYGKNHAMQVYMLLGIGGLPSDPDGIYLVSLTEPLDISTLIENPVSTPDEILQRIIRPEPKQNSSYMRMVRDKYPNAYKPWREEDDNLLAELYSEGRTVEDMTYIFQRNKGGITSRLNKLGLGTK